MAQSFSGPLLAAALPIDANEATNAVHRPGEIIFTNDGRAFRFCEAGASALDPGKLQSSEAEDTGEQNLAVAATAIGATSVVTTTTGTVVVDEYSWGFLAVTVTPGVGKAYRISGHAAYTTAAMTFNLDDPIEVALTTDSRIDVIANPYMNLVITPSSATGCVVGVSHTAISIAQFGWIQVNGPGVVLAQAAVTVGLDVTNSNATAGAVENADSDSQVLVGQAITGIADTEYGLVNIRLL